MNYEARDTLGMYKRRTPDPDGYQGPGPGIMGAATLIGNYVFNLDERDVGRIKEIMLDMRSGQVLYATLSFGGFLGVGEKLLTVPWNALRLDKKNKRFTLSVPRSPLAQAPGFDREHWPRMADPF